MSRIQAVVFPEEPGCVMFYVPPGERLSIKSLKGLSKSEILEACGQVLFREAPLGRLYKIAQQAKNTAKSEEGARLYQETLTTAALLRGSTSPLIRGRSEALLRKQLVDEEVRQLKVRIGKAKTDLHTQGRYTDPTIFRKWEVALEKAKSESQALQTRLGQLRQEEKSKAANEHLEGLERFKREARRLLPSETYDAIWQAAEVGEDE